ncbi:MAG TPA: hypothetical protein DCY88_02580 [Cyanobacteria bacterium UBA11372]|nr:hypothetical protein [Cyanobacteria bacterium UBA11372]
MSIYLSIELLKVKLAHSGLDGKTLASASDDQTAVLWDLSRILNLDLMAYSCDRVRDYLRTNVGVVQALIANR